MAEYLGPSTDNEAVVISNTRGHKVPDIYATGTDPTDADHDTLLKFGNAHPKRIHNDIYSRYGQDSEVDDPC